MEKIQLIVLGLSASPAGTNAYALILKEIDGTRRLPIIIGAFEAQAIALELEGVVPPRPMTHDLIKSVIDKLESYVSEVVINDLKDGTFYAKIILEDTYELDARPSDAIALAIRCSCPVFVNSDVLDETAIYPQGDETDLHEDDLKYVRDQKDKQKGKPKTKVEQIQVQLDKAILDEDYEKAAKLRDELRRIFESS